MHWPWCIRNDAPVTDTSFTRVQLEVRWKDVVKTVYVDASATASEVAMTAYTAVVAALEGNVITAPPELPIILKVCSVRSYEAREASGLEKCLVLRSGNGLE